jgi:hypothetical protein
MMTIGFDLEACELASNPEVSAGLQEGLPEHLLGIAGADWAFWRSVCLRGAGFPGHLVLQLAADKAAAAADEILASEKRAGESQEALRQALRRELDGISDPEQRKPLTRALKQLGKGKMPEKIQAANLEHEMAMESASRVEKARSEFEASFREEVAAVSARIVTIAQDDAFRQAVLLQNRGALRRVLRSLAEVASGQKKRGFKERQNEEMIANYLQRYCVKNDSIGFFGPIGWGRFVPHVEGTVVQPGAKLIESSGIYFEDWCIEMLAQKMGEDKGLRPWLVPRRAPTIYLDGISLHVPGGAVTTLPPPHAALLKKCNGEKTAREIAQELVKTRGSGIFGEEQAYKMLEQLAEKGLVRWQLEIACEANAEKRLRSQLERIENAELRRPMLEMLEEIDSGRTRVDAAIGNADQLDSALGALEESFVRLTGKSTSRAAGQMYAGRTLIYQDCRRDIELEIGPEVTGELAKPLSLLITSARWFTHRTAAIYREALGEIYNELARKSRRNSIDLLQFWFKAQDAILDPKLRLFERIIPEYQALWNQILDLPEGQSRAHFTSDELREKVEAAFAAPKSGWKRARYHSPDVMIAADSVASIRQGNYSLVLGELHMAVNTVRGVFAMAQHPDPPAMFEAFMADMGEPRMVPVPPREWPGMTTRNMLALYSPKDYHLEISADAPASVPRSQTLPIGAFVVENAPRGLQVRSRDGRLRFDVIEFFGEVFSAQSTDCMKIAPQRAHVPRVTIDKLVICRETWRFPAESMQFIHVEEESQRYLAARRWMRQNNLPRFAFMKVHVETKPCFIDFDSPIYVEILCKMARRVLASDEPEKPVVISEMVPGPDQLWLPDAEGQKYTSEMRLVVLDLKE